MLIRIYEKLRNNNNISLIVCGTGKLETFLREKGIDVRTFQKETTFIDMLS